MRVICWVLLPLFCYYLFAFEIPIWFFCPHYWLCSYCFPLSTFPHGRVFPSIMFSLKIICFWIFYSCPAFLLYLCRSSTLKLPFELTFYLWSPAFVSTSCLPYTVDLQWIWRAMVGWVKVVVLSWSCSDWRFLFFQCFYFHLDYRLCMHRSQ